MTDQPTSEQLRTLATLGYPKTRLPSWTLAAYAITDIKHQQSVDRQYVPPAGVSREPRASAHQLKLCRRAGYKGPPGLPAHMVRPIIAALTRSR
jgi:hypothetical protein